MTIKGEWKRPIKDLQKDLDKRIENVGRHLGREMAVKTTRIVRKRLKGGGWIKLYRDAIFYRETPDGDHWAIAGLAEQANLTKFPAETSLASFTATGDGVWPSEYNPWPIDMIPPAYYRGSTVVVRNASAGTVDGYRVLRSKNLPTLLNVLAARNIRVNPDGYTTAENGVFADIVHLATRLETGADGFPRVPHWGPAASAASTSVGQWMSQPKILRLVEGAIMGALPNEVPQMTKAEASDLARLSKATWP